MSVRLAQIVAILVSTQAASPQPPCSNQGWSWRSWPGNVNPPSFTKAAKPERCAKPHSALGLGGSHSHMQIVAQASGLSFAQRSKLHRRKTMHLQWPHCSVPLHILHRATHPQHNRPLHFLHSSSGQKATRLFENRRVSSPVAGRSPPPPAAELRYCSKLPTPCTTHTLLTRY